MWHLHRHRALIFYYYFIFITYFLQAWIKNRSKHTKSPQFRKFWDDFFLLDEEIFIYTYDITNNLNSRWEWVKVKRMGAVQIDFSLQKLHHRKTVIKWKNSYDLAMHQPVRNIQLISEYFTAHNCIMDCIKLKLL